MNSVTHHFEILAITRNNVLNLLEGLTYSQVIKVPEGFNNSILWNAVHNLTVQQLLCYKLSNLELTVDPKFIDAFKKGSTGSETISETDFEEFKKVYASSVDRMSEDYNKGIFKTYNTYTTSYNITLYSVEETIAFNNTHEGLHLGYMMALRKLV